MDYAIVIALDVLYGVAFLALISVGLAIIFGMMRVINLAHGEFMMLGVYAAVVGAEYGINTWIAMLVVAPVVVGAIGFVVERVVIRFLYGRMVDTMLATWGLSLFFIGLITMIFGAESRAGFSAPIGPIEIGVYKKSGYNLFLIFFTIVLLAAVYGVLRYTKVGLVARGTMQNPDMASALGVSPSFVYSATFTVGAALSGLAGGLLAPISNTLPTVGISYIAKSFITVIGGGASILTGTATASTLFGTVSQFFSFLTTPVFGDIALLVVAVVMLRLLPRGITGKFFKGAP